MKHLLVGTDLSDRSKPALARAIQLAAQHGARLSVLHVVHEDVPGRFVNEILDERRAALQAELVSAQSVNKLEAEALTAWGDAFSEMVQFAEKNAVDLVILGTRKKSALRDTFLGTTAERIVRNVQVPSLIVRGATEGQYKNVLAAVDGGACARSALRFAHELAPDALLSVLHIYQEAGSDLERSRQTAQGLVQFELNAVLGAGAGTSANVRSLVRVGAFVDGVVAQCQLENCHLLALGAHGRPSFARAIWGSRTLELLRDPPCDVLVGPASAKTA